MNYIVFAILTALCWGLYGPTLAQARSATGSPFKPYVAIGVAYLVWGVLGGILGMLARKESFAMSGAGVGWGFVAGTVGAWGAFTLTVAMVSGGGRVPHVVMSIVFGGAVTVTALVSAWMTRGQHETKPLLWVGIVGILVCAVLVAYNTPHAAPAKPSGHAAAPAAVGTGPQTAAAERELPPTTH